MDTKVDDRALQKRGNSLYESMESLLVAMAVLGALSASGIVLIIGASVSMRYFAFAPLSFTEELVGLLMTVSFFLALPLVTLRSEHVRISVFVAALSEKYRSLATKISRILGMTFCVWLIVLSIPWLEFAIDRNIKTEVGRLLMYPWMLVIPISIILTMIAFILQRPPTKEPSSRSNLMS
ncbi:MAG: C4-dicarboxylate ABC transporter [Gammaproteobacteria bacterium]|nr:C4-dicarboxylate ABC transporter [Gammaproteobacteria bacterium]